MTSKVPELKCQESCPTMFSRLFTFCQVRGMDRSWPAGYDQRMAKRDKFDLATFKYFDLAQKKGKDKAWFLAHQDLYQEHVRGPLLELITNLWAALDDELPGDPFHLKQ